MSLMAIILICAAPALVSVIDDTYVYEGTSEVQLVDTDIAPMSSFIRAPTPEDPVNNASASYIPASENDGTFVLVLNDSSEINNVTYARFDGIDVAPLMSGTGLKVVTSSDLIRVTVNLYNSDDDTLNSQIYLTQSEADTSVWSKSLSSVDLVKIRSGAYDYAMVYMVGPNELYDMEIYSVGEYLIPYGEIVVGATGALLLICALFATPYFGLNGGYTGPKSKRRGA